MFLRITNRTGAAVNGIPTGSTRIIPETMTAYIEYSSTGFSTTKDTASGSFTTATPIASAGVRSGNSTITGTTTNTVTYTGSPATGSTGTGTTTQTTTGVAVFTASANLTIELGTMTANGGWLAYSSSAIA